MFNNLVKSSRGRIATKALAALLVISLTFTNFALVATLMFESSLTERSTFAVWTGGTFWFDWFWPTESIPYFLSYHKI